jgi:hypothetical protein
MSGQDKYDKEFPPLLSELPKYGKPTTDVGADADGSTTPVPNAGESKREPLSVRAEKNERAVLATLMNGECPSELVPAALEALKKGCFSKKSDDLRALATSLLDSINAEGYYSTSHEQRLASIEFILFVVDEGTKEHKQAVFLKEEEERNFPSNDGIDALKAFIGL